MVRKTIVMLCLPLPDSKGGIIATVRDPQLHSSAVSFLRLLRTHGSHTQHWGHTRILLTTPYHHLLASPLESATFAIQHRKSVSRVLHSACSASRCTAKGLRLEILPFHNAPPELSLLPHCFTLLLPQSHPHGPALASADAARQVLPGSHQQ